MLRIFLDSSVLFAASYSSKGYARDLIRLSINKIIVPIASPLVFEETRRNLAFFSAVSLPYLEKVIELVNFEIVIPTKKDVQDATSGSENRTCGCFDHDG
jgi:predicted nucleic acid-binding protein